MSISQHVSMRARKRTYRIVNICTWYTRVGMDDYIYQSLILNVHCMNVVFVYVHFTYIYIYIYMCVCVCVRPSVGPSALARVFVLPITLVNNLTFDNVFTPIIINHFG